ncbi:NADH:ubiquinone oxidoreductase 11.5kD subunit [Colletotrichum musicola]|uniref:NADH dehydrogenase [ubiquinone] iron-sulfur protein 5 n=3 Tax=Colletotrichum orchidearum species complex TaxID=2707337 RepID=A0A8H6KS66_9PEZI|nr:NADH:ubiquinone oxidoreductase 11.5kD subunit [Colletotrichum sojae]KAF6835825.1 NADH:ubiquinone oxidoreductase 11.5kD subunit [Colletotrichum plurivorum]KAF6836108.1 NADH:ubiquinone oxidoreductase 11.5kD subunit [Colletotrichum musicola]
MASGYGLHGGPSRCFPFWQELLSCYVVNTADDDHSGKKKCAFALEDYYECLHHKKESARTVAMQTADRKAKSATERDNGLLAVQIRNFGTVGKEDDTKAVTASS